MVLPHKRHAYRPSSRSELPFRVQKAAPLVAAKQSISLDFSVIAVGSGKSKPTIAFALPVGGVWPNCRQTGATPSCIRRPPPNPWPPARWTSGAAPNSYPQSTPAGRFHDDGTFRALESLPPRRGSIRPPAIFRNGASQKGFEQPPRHFHNLPRRGRWIKKNYSVKPSLKARLGRRQPSTHI